jgi:hexosaminidase
MRFNVTWTNALIRFAVFVFAFVLPQGAWSNGQPKAFNLMPMPAKVTPGDGVLRLDSTFDVTVHGPSDERLHAAVRRFVSRIAHQTGLPLINVPSAQGVLVIECHAAAPAVPRLGEDESYQLKTSLNGARLSAPTVTGVLRGLETFAQLVTADSVSFYLPAVQIDDKPRFPWRGLMIDAARHWMPVPTILRNLDAMAAVKLNVFHWHVSDDQGFRVESKLYPRFQQLSSDGNYYTQDEVRQVVGYARDRGIRVVPEFDMPGHTTAWFAAYPEYASAPGPYRIERRWGVFEPVLDPSREEVYQFLDRLLGEMIALFPDEYFHIGGDEVLDTQWKHNPAIQAFAVKNDLKTGDDLQGYFTRRVEQIVIKHGKKMMGWDEIMRPGLSPESMIQSWRGPKSLAEAAQKGLHAILSSGYYLDHLQPAATHYAVDPLQGIGELTPEQTALIAGGEACMFSEYVNGETVDSRLWPRTAAIAERLWSPREVKDVESMYSRMEVVGRFLDWTGAEHRANYYKALDRLSAGSATEPLRVLTEAVEATGIVGRRVAQKYTSLTPLNRVVDAARPESESIRHLTGVAATFLADPANHSDDKARLRSTFTVWRDNHSRLLPIIRSNYLLAGVTSVSEHLSKVGVIGLQALDYVESGKQPDASWITAQKEFLDLAEAPDAEVVLTATKPVRTLVQAAANVQSPRAQTRRK